MEWLDKTGLAEQIKRSFMNNTPVFGICGGYQIMGKTVSDPNDTECGGTVSGLGILNAETVFRTEKTQKRSSGAFGDISGFFSCLSGARFNGYEIHMGETFDNGPPLTDCGGSFNKNAAGCYVHGIFDSADVCGRLIKKLYNLEKLSSSSDSNKETKKNIKVLCIGASTGGPTAVQKVLSGLGNSFPLPVLYTQHIDIGADEKMVRWFNQVCPNIPMSLAKDGEIARKGHVYMAPADKHLIRS